jgi:hypothetical protein
MFAYKKILIRSRYTLKKINWSLLGLHALAIPFLILGARQLQAIRWQAIARVYQQSGLAGLQQHYPTWKASDMLASMFMGPLYAWGLAVLLGCVLSAGVVWQRRESWLIPLGILCLSIVSSWSHYYESAVVNSALAWLRWPLEAYSAESRLGFAGGLLVIVGLLPFLFTWERTPTTQQV